MANEWKMRGGFSIRAFSLCAACLFFPVALMLSFALIGAFTSKNAEYIDSRRIQSEQITTLLTKTFSAIDNTAWEILDSQWHAKLASRSGLWNDEFTSIKMAEVMGDLKYKVAVLEIVKDILVPVREPGLVVSPTLFSPRRTYEALASSTIDIDQADATESTFDILPSVDADELALLYKTDSSASYARSVILIVSRQALSSLMGSVNQSQFTSIRVFYLGGKARDATEALAAYGNADRPDHMRLAQHAGRFHVEFQYPSYASLCGHLELANSALYLLSALALSCVLAFVFTRYYAAPIERLLRYARHAKSHHRSRKDLLSCIDELITNNQTLKDAITRYSETLQKSMYFDMLSNPEFNFGNAFVLLALPENYTQLSYFLMLFKIQDAEDLINRLEAQKWAYGIRAVKRFNLPFNEECAIVWTQNTGTTLSAIAGIARDFGDLSIVFSDACLDLRSMHGAYVRLREEFEKASHARRESLPFDREVALISLLQRQAVDEIPALLDALRSGDVDWAKPVYALLLRFSQENQLNMSEESGRAAGALGTQDAWSSIAAAITDICAQMSGIRTRGTKDIIRIIDEILENQFSNSELSLKYLSERFNISQTALSRTYKAQTGRNYYERLTDIRMNHALELVRRTEKSLIEIARLVGYENYLSFKRAFGNYFGKSPRDCRESAQQNEWPGAKDVGKEHLR